MSPNNWRLVLIVSAVVATPACGGNCAVPSNTGATNASLPFSVQGNAVSPRDNTSILKKLKKDVVIGSTVDPTNGDMGPRALSVVGVTFGGLKKGQLLVCNFADSSGTAGKGTTIEVLDSAPGSTPKRLVQNSKIEGCDGDAITSGNEVYGAGLTGGVVEAFNPNGKPKKTYGSPIKEPFADADAFCGQPYAPEDLYVGDAKTGGIVKFAVGLYGNPNEVQVIGGFAVNSGSGWGVLGPSGIQYNGHRKGSLCNDTLYIVDGVDNTVVAVSNVSSLLQTNEIVVQPGGKTFKCKHKKTTCATLVYSGSPLNAPVASALLPNGNLVVANTHGGNKLVELTPSGTVLATKSVDKSTIAHVFGLLATGTSDSNTVLFYTDTKDNSVHELEQ
jgi:hypothetical protein